MGALVGMAFDGLVRALAFAAQALAALALAGVALAVAVVGAAAVFVSLLASLLASAFVAVKPFAFVVVRLGCVAGCVAGVASALGPLVEAYGGDVAAILPAACLLLSPVAFVVRIGAGFGGVLLAGVAAAVLGATLPGWSPVVRALTLIVIIGAVFFYSLLKGDDHDRAVEV